MSVRIQFDWVDAAPSPDTAAQRTMAALSMEIAGKMVTSVVDHRSQSFRRHIVVPLYCVADWLVTNWWHLWYEVGDRHELKDGFFDRHSLAVAGNGFVLPNLTIVSSGGSVHLQCRRWEPYHASIQFPVEAESHVDAQNLEHQFRTIIDAVLERLRDVGSESSDVQDLADKWDAINGLDADELEFSRAAALLGIDPFDANDQIAEEISTFWDHATPAVREEALAGADESSLRRVSTWLGGTVEALSGNDNENDWAQIRNMVLPFREAEPWNQGYELAKSVRKYLNISDGRFEFESDGPLAVCHSEVEVPNNRIEGLVAASAPACATVKRGETGKRFLLARAIGDYISRPEAGFGILGSMSTERQARSRAFAAELLAPAECLRSRIESADVQEETIDELGREFGVSTYLVRRQVENHSIGMPLRSNSWF